MADRFLGKAVPQPDAFVPLLWLGWPGRAVFSPPSARVTQAFVLPAHTGSQSPPLSWQLLPRLAGTGGPGDTTGAGKRGTPFLGLHFWYQTGRGYTHTNTPVFLPLDPRPDLESGGLSFRRAKQYTVGGVDRGQRAVTQEEVWALRSQASGEEKARKRG